MMGTERKDPKTTIVKQRLNLVCLPPTSLRIGMLTVFWFLQGPKTTLTIPIWGAGLRLMGKKKKKMKKKNKKKRKEGHGKE